MMNCLSHLVKSSIRPVFSGGHFGTLLPMFHKTYSIPIMNASFSGVSQRIPTSPSLLAPPTPVTTTQVAGFKVKHTLKKRCKDCFFTFSHERMMVLCPTHPRHKQITPYRRPRYTWILTHASQSKVRPW